MSNALEYRQRAIEQRRAADSTMLQMVRLKHLSAAERWDYLAEQIEWCERGMLNLTNQGQQIFR